MTVRVDVYEPAGGTMLASTDTVTVGARCHIIGGSVDATAFAPDRSGNSGDVTLWFEDPDTTSHVGGARVEISVDGEPLGVLVSDHPDYTGRQRTATLSLTGLEQRLDRPAPSAYAATATVDTHISAIVDLLDADLEYRRAHIDLSLVGRLDAGGSGWSTIVGLCGPAAAIPAVDRFGVLGTIVPVLPGASAWAADRDDMLGDPVFGRVDGFGTTVDVTSLSGHQRTVDTFPFDGSGRRDDVRFGRYRATVGAVDDSGFNAAVADIGERQEAGLLGDRRVSFSVPGAVLWPLGSVGWVSDGGRSGLFRVRALVHRFGSRGDGLVCDVVADEVAS